jgi:hypothetical protein
MSSDHYIDEIHAFFLNCYHLKDWIKHDGTVPVSRQQQVEALINSSRGLKLCADICNGLKHLRLTTSRSGENPVFGRKQFAVTLGTEPTTISLKYEVDTDSGPTDAFEIATECVQAWDRFVVTL